MILTTIHDNSEEEAVPDSPDGQEDILKLLVVEEYNKNMEDIDTDD